MVGFKQRLAERIIEARESKGWDQRELAFRAKVSDKTIQRLEQARVDAPRGSTLQKIAEATGREVAELRPDMDTEERNLRAQLDRIEAVVTELRDHLTAEAGDLDAALADVEQADEAEDANGQGASRHRIPAPKRRRRSA